MKSSKLNYVMPIIEQEKIFAGGAGCFCTAVTDTATYVAPRVTFVFVEAPR